ncbi:MAG TPA: AMP-binding protein [Ramlibacter sp.]|nr:AMP-binding protein [Ramlibacter sp.]
MPEREPAQVEASAPLLLEALAREADAHEVDMGEGTLRAMRGVLHAQDTVLVAFDYRQQHGSIGVQEATQLVRVIGLARSWRAHLVFLLETSGIRVTDSTAGIGSLRRLLRAALDARLDGVRMLAVVLRSAFGGASLLASVCEKRVLQADALFAMSGPRLIALEPWQDGEGEGFVRRLLLGGARAGVSSDFVLVPPGLPAYADAIHTWLREAPTPVLNLQVLHGRTEALGHRLLQPVPGTVGGTGATALPQPMGDLLRAAFPEGFELRRCGNVYLADAPGSATRAVALVRREGASAQDALALARALADPHLAGSMPGRCLLLVDCESHSAAAGDEAAVLSECLAHLALVTRAVVRRGEQVDMVVAGHSGGGIHGTLSSAASTTAMTPDSRLFVLPRAAMGAIGKAEDAQAGSPQVAVAAQAVDTVILAGEQAVADVGNFYELFARRVRENADAPCVHTEQGQVLTRRWMDQWSARYANALLAAGCVAGDRAAVQVEKSPQALALYLGCLRAGLVFLPLNTAYQASELAYLLADARPRVFVGTDTTVAREAGIAAFSFDAQGAGTLADAAAPCALEVPSQATAPEAIAALLYTSGTTGRPKGAMLSHRSLAHAARTLGTLWRFTDSDVLLHTLPLFHAHGLFISSNTALAAGASLLFQDKFDAPRVVEALGRATVFMGVPTYYHRLLGQPGLQPELCRNVRLFTCGSAPLSAEVHREFAQRTGHQIVERYGTTETMIISSNPLDGERRPGAVGLPLPGVEFRIADGDDQPLAAGEVGMIQVRGDGLFSGYWMKPEQSREEFSADGYFRTGDLGRVGEGGYVSITGRSKDLIISGGYNVYPAEVESAIDEMPSVRECAVIGKPHPDFGEAVVAFVIPTDATRPPHAADVIQWAKKRLANFKVPKQVVVVDELPRNVMGKVLKNQLRAGFAPEPSTIN